MLTPMTRVVARKAIGKQYNQNAYWIAKVLLYMIAS